MQSCAWSLKDLHLKNMKLLLFNTGMCMGWGTDELSKSQTVSRNLITHPITVRTPPLTTLRACTMRKINSPVRDQMTLLWRPFSTESPSMKSDINLLYSASPGNSILSGFAQTSIWKHKDLRSSEVQMTKGSLTSKWPSKIQVHKKGKFLSLLPQSPKLSH